MRDSYINWQNKDNLSLGRAVANYNKRIRKLKEEEKLLRVPEEINFKETKENIKTRKELNRVLASLRSLKKENIEETVKLKNGLEITKYEYENLLSQRKILQNRLRQDLKNENFKKGLMGSERKDSIRAQLQSTKNFLNADIKEFNRMKKIIINSGTYDWRMKKSLIYQDNYFYALFEGARGFKNYDKLINYLNKIKNPEKFFEFIQSNDFMSDLFLWYDDNNHYLKYGGYLSNEQAFDEALMNLGILEE